MRPSEVLDHQAALLDYLPSQAYARYVEGFIGDMVKKGKVVEASRPGFNRTLAASLRVAQAFHVQAEMMPVLRAAAHDLEGTDHMVHERLPAEHGFLMFDDSWLTSEAWGRTVTVKALQWWHGSASVADRVGGQGVLQGIWIAQYSDLTDERDEVNAELFERYGDQILSLGRLHLADLRFLPYGVRVGPTENLTDEEYAQYAQRGQVLAKQVPNDNRLVVALFRLLSQVLVEVKDAPLDRPAQRRAKRANIPARVQTVKLRRKEVRYLHPGERDSAPVEWQHSWWVRGHWAWRKCGAEHPLAEEYEKGFRARIYIAPYPKGPEDKPLLITEKVWDLAQ